MFEYILIDVPKYGWLCKILNDDKEVYRGEYQLTYFEAMEKALDWVSEHE